MTAAVMGWLTSSLATRHDALAAGRESDTICDRLPVRTLPYNKQAIPAGLLSNADFDCGIERFAAAIVDAVDRLGYFPVAQCDFRIRLLKSLSRKLGSL
jgi:hypothetical protein